MSVLFRGFNRLVAGSNVNAMAKGTKVTARSQQQLFLQNGFSSEAVKAATKDEIDKLVKNKKLVVFMKGVPEEPRCGFSNAVVQVLRMQGVTSYDSYDVLQNESVRQGIKAYSNWPTIPQIYINGEFVGGCDIVLEMHKNGELKQELEKAGIKCTSAEDK